nr:hypothetical protein [Oscillochloris trichoides]
MFWLSLLVLMILVASAPGISMYVEHRNGASGQMEMSRSASIDSQ